MFLHPEAVQHELRPQNIDCSDWKKTIFETPGSVLKRMRIKTLLSVIKNIKKVLTRFVKDVTIHQSHGISALILKE